MMTYVSEKKTQVYSLESLSVAHRMATLLLVWSLVFALSAGVAMAGNPCDSATHPSQCGWFDSSTLPPFVRAAIIVKGGVPVPAMSSF